MDASRTVFELKSAFIRAQVRILSESLEPPEDWRIYTTESEEDELSDKAVQDALQKCEYFLGLVLCCLNCMMSSRWKSIASHLNVLPKI
jgi:hypothetical protein